MQQHRALILRSNRFLGSALVDKELIKSEDLEAANEKFMEHLQGSESAGNASILYSLLYELKTLDEAKLVDLLVEESKIGMVDLTQLKLNSLRPIGLEVSDCKATWTLPFDHIEDTYMIATCYYLSNPAIQFWEDKYKKKVIWYGTSMSSMLRAFDRIQELHDAEDVAAEEAAAEEAEAAAAEVLANSKIAEASNTSTESTNSENEDPKKA